MRLGALKAWLAPQLDEGLEIATGLEDPQVPGRFVLLTPTSGSGFSTESLFDVTGFQVKSVGDQLDYDGAEDLAWTIDKILVGGGGSRVVAGVWTLGVARFGGGPTQLLEDDADRHHFICNYMVEAESE